MPTSIAAIHPPAPAHRPVPGGDEMPDLPDPEHVASRPCALGGGDVLTQESAAAHVSDLAELEALAERFGFAVGDGRAVDLFTAPDAIRRSIAAA